VTHENGYNDPDENDPDKDRDKDDYPKFHRADNTEVAEELVAVGLASDVSETVSGRYEQETANAPTSWLNRFGKTCENIVHIFQGIGHGGHLQDEVPIDKALKNVSNEIGEEIEDLSEIRALSSDNTNGLTHPKDLVDELNRARVDFFLQHITKIDDHDEDTLHDLAERFERDDGPKLVEDYCKRRLQELDAENARAKSLKNTLSLLSQLDVELPQLTMFPESRSACTAILEYLIDPPQKVSLDSSVQAFFAKLRSDAKEQNSTEENVELAHAKINLLERAAVLLIKHEETDITQAYIKETLCEELFNYDDIQEILTPSQSSSEPGIQFSPSDYPRISAKDVLTELQAQVIDEIAAYSINPDKHPADLEKRLSQKRAAALESAKSIGEFSERAAKFERDEVPKIIAEFRDSLKHEKRTVGEMLAVEKIFDQHGIQLDLPKEQVAQHDPVTTLGLVREAIFAAKEVSKDRTDWSEIESACREAIERPDDLAAGREISGPKRPATISV
jgi:hypothetical protein